MSGKALMQTAIFPGRYVQADGALERLGEEVTRLGHHALVAGGTAERSIIPPFLFHKMNLVDLAPTKAMVDLLLKSGHHPTQSWTPRTILV